MPEALTESFCERCGTRYEFNAPATLSPLRRTRGLVSGLKNYIMSQDALSDTIGDAMRSEEDTLAARQLDAFHASFNFCIQCRQYTCLNCWNDGVGRCRTCAPIAGTDDLIERIEASFHAAHPALAVNDTSLVASDASGPSPALSDQAAWPSSDLEVAGNGHADLLWPAAELVGESTEPERQPELAQEPLLADEREPAPSVEVEPEPLPAIEIEPSLASHGAFAATEPEPAEPRIAPAVLAWQEDATLELLPEVSAEVPIELEPEAEVQPSIPYEPEPAAAVEPEPEPEAVEDDTVPEPAVDEPAAAIQPEPEPRSWRPITSISDTILRLPERRPADEDLAAAAASDPALQARRAQLDLLGLGDPGEGPVSASRPNVVPYRSTGAAASPAPGGTQTAGSFWEASAREVAGGLGQVTVQSCGHCGLSLSASARFCRRCGTRQAQPA